MAQKIDIKLWLSTNASKVTGAISGGFKKMQQGAKDASGKVLELATQLQGCENATAKSVGAMAEVLDAFATGGPIGAATAAVVLLITNITEAQKQAEELDQKLAEHFAQSMEKLRTIAMNVRMEGLREDVDYAIKRSEELQGKLAKASSQWNLQREADSATAAGAHGRAMGNVEGERLRQRGNTTDAWERELIDLQAEAEKAKLLMKEQNRLAEEAVTIAKHDRDLKMEEAAMIDKKNAILAEQVGALKEELSTVHSAADQKPILEKIWQLDEKIAGNKEKQDKLLMEGSELEIKLQRATDKMERTRVEGSQAVYRAQMNISDAFDGHAKEERKAAEKTAEMAKKAEQDDKTRAIRDDLLKAKSAYEQALRNIGKSPAERGGNANDFVNDFKNKLAQDRQNTKDRNRAEKRLKSLQDKEKRLKGGKGKLGGKMSRQDQEELEALKKFFGIDDETKKKMKLAEESKKHLENIEKQLADAMKVG